MGLIPNTDMFRFYAHATAKRRNYLNPELLKVSNLASGSHEMPTHKLLRTYRIILSTLCNVGRLPLNGFPQDHFSYIFIDECGSATEPSALIPIAGLISKENHLKTNLVLAGDPKQLGPIVVYQFVADCGMDTSLLERLMNMELYKPKPYYNRRVITKLLQNFRSHPAILDVPNKLFYRNELKACAPERLTHWACTWSALPNKKKPIIFHNVNGHSHRDPDSPSLYNFEEIDVVVEYAKKLIKLAPQKDIGIITPYLKQKYYLKQALDRCELSNIDVGTVEAYQGQERQVIIISTVRVSNGSGNIGFLVNPKVKEKVFKLNQVLI